MAIMQAVPGHVLTHKHQPAAELSEGQVFSLSAMEFQFSTPGRQGMDTTPINNHHWDQQVASSWFKDWVGKTASTQPSPKLLAANVKVVKAQDACTQDNVSKVDQRDRYEGQTADELFTRWLATTEAVLSSPAITPGPQSGAPTPNTCSRFTASPSAEILALQGHPLSLLRAARVQQHALGGGWYGASPMPTGHAMARWREDGASDSEAADDGQSYSAEDSSSDGPAQAVGRDAGSDVEPLIHDKSALSSIMDGLSMLGMAPVEEQAGMASPGPDDMMITPVAARHNYKHAQVAAAPPTPIDEVLALMVSPAPAQRVRNPAPAAAAMPPPDLGQQQPGPSALHFAARADGHQAAEDSDADEGLGTPQLAGWGTDESADSSSDDDDELDLASMGFTPLPGIVGGGMHGHMMLSPMQELIGLMMSPVMHEDDFQPDD